MKVRAYVIVSGRVQGVYFRGKTRQKARKYGVTGWIRNLPDGSVEAVFEGEEDQVAEIIEFVKLGPSYAQVTDLKIQWQDYKGEFPYFTIIY